MPYPRKDAPYHIPECELIESLLSWKRKHDKILPLQDLNDEERQKTNLVEIGKRTARIQGDPYGVWSSWAGNVSHQEDKDVEPIMNPILDKLISIKRKESPEIVALRQLLEGLPTTDPCSLAFELAEEGSIAIDIKTPNQVAITFRLDGKHVRIVHALDLDVDDEKTYDQAAGAKSSAQKVKEHLGENTMPLSAQQLLMAKILADNWPGYQPLVNAEVAETRTTGKSSSKGIFAHVRSLAQERYWLDMSSVERAEIRKVAEAAAPETELATTLRLVKESWNQRWNNGARDVDFFRSYHMDQTAAKEVWTLVDEDVVIVLDKNQRVVLANIENLAQMLLGDEAVDLLERAIDLWSFFMPLPLPESRRHVMDRYIRRIHPELDPSKATVETLPNAKMAVAHYGCWSQKGDPHGRQIFATADTLLIRVHNHWWPKTVFERFAKAVFGKSSELIRFLVEPLNAGHYKECVEVFDNLPKLQRLSVDEKEDWISLFALGINGYTQRHRDIGDVQGGLAGLLTLGRYTAANLCFPQLGIKVPYAPGACAIIRGHGLEHLVQDYSGPRFFVIGTNHESCKRHAWRRLGRLPPLPPPVPRGQKRKGRDKSGESSQVGESDDSSDSEADYGPCRNDGNDQDDEDEIVWTNEMLHGAAALPLKAVRARSTSVESVESGTDSVTSTE
ncbi:hypothetical protein OQA88_9410 [Cercophora sp. LCS_1]